MKWLALVGWVALCLVVGGIAAQFEPGGWYAELRRPGWTPPDWLFAPVWTVLYLLMGVAAWLVWRVGGWSGARPALILFLVQLCLNGAWSWLFFGLHRIGVAMLDMVLLWLAVLATIVAFWRYTRPAAVLLVPYWLWVSYAAALNFALWGMNV